MKEGEEMKKLLVGIGISIAALVLGSVVFIFGGLKIADRMIMEIGRASCRERVLAGV